MNEIFIDQIPSDIIDKNYLTNFYNNDIFEVTFLYKSNFNNAKYLRDYLFIILDILWVNSIWKNRFVLIVDELNNNAIEYGSKEWGLNIFRFTSTTDRNKITLNIEVEDEWSSVKSKKSIDMYKLKEERLEKWFDNHNSIRWRGLFLIITKLVDNLYFNDSQQWWLIVWINKTLEVSI